MEAIKTSRRKVTRYWSHEKSGTHKPKKSIMPCPNCGKQPSYFASSGGFNYYGYYKCVPCELFATGRHQFPAIGIAGFGANENNEPRLFVEYNDETNAEDGWNAFTAKPKTKDKER